MDRRGLSTFKYATRSYEGAPRSELYRQHRQQELNELLPKIRSRVDIESRVDSLTKKAPEISYLDDRRKKILVVIEQTGEDDVTTTDGPFTIVCGVTLIKRKAQPQDPTFILKSAEFAFAKIPTSMLQHFIDDPHALHNPNGKRVVRAEPIETHPPTTRPGQSTLLSTNRLGRLDNFAVMRLFDLSQSMDIVLDAVNDHELNSHLYPEPSSDIDSSL